jgi:hypothetical protein
MEQQLLPLKDIHLPSTINWWPLAYGWWRVSGFIVLLTLAWYFRHTLRAWIAPGLCKIALRHLNSIANNTQLTPQKKVQHISQLLRRSAISSSTRDQVAGLAGEQWLQFLDGDDPHLPFSKGIGRSLIDAPYRPDAQLDIDALLELAGHWLKQNTRRKAIRSS